MGGFGTALCQMKAEEQQEGQDKEAADHRQGRGQGVGARKRFVLDDDHQEQAQQPPGEDQQGGLFPLPEDIGIFIQPHHGQRRKEDQKRGSRAGGGNRPGDGPGEQKQQRRGTGKVKDQQTGNRMPEMIAPEAQKVCFVHGKPPVRRQPVPA